MDEFPSIFAEFPSATDATNCAITIQNKIQKFNDINPKDFQMHVGIGLHMAEVHEEDGDLLSYETDCKDCGLQFFEYYHVKYKHSYGVEYTEQTKENRPMQTNGIDSDALDEIQYSCCGDEMTGILEDVQICPTCKEHQ